MKRHVDWFKETILSRTTDVTKTRFVIVMQRLHNLDLAGHFIDAPGWDALILPSEYNPAKTRSTSIGWTDPRTEEGEPLFPERFPKSYLNEQKGPFGLGPVAYAAQHLQDPISEEGAMVKREWWKFWSDDPKVKADKSITLADLEVDRLIGSWDMTFKRAEDNDFVVGQVWAVTGSDFILLDQIRARLNFPETKAAFRRLAADWPWIETWLVEEKANGAAIIDELKTEIPGIIPIVPKESKEARLAAVSPLIQAGNVYVPHPELGKSFSLMLVDEVSAFPQGEFDDTVDALSQALRYLRDWYTSVKAMSEKPPLPPRAKRGKRKVPPSHQRLIQQAEQLVQRSRGKKAAKPFRAGEDPDEG